MALYKMSELAPLAMAEINEIIRLAELKERRRKARVVKRSPPIR